MNRTWSYDQTKILKEKYGVLPVVALALVLSKTETAVLKKASKMGLKSNLPHKVKLPLSTIKNLRERGFGTRQIARLIGCSHGGVAYAEKHHYFKRRDNES
tara:strand:- start:1784 stop:2086 length:303 start_codon:yes stop_codon:yes gene_type:complete